MLKSNCTCSVFRAMIQEEKIKNACVTFSIVTALTRAFLPDSLCCRHKAINGPRSFCQASVQQRNESNLKGWYSKSSSISLKVYGSLPRLNKYAAREFGQKQCFSNLRSIKSQMHHSHLSSPPPPSYCSLPGLHCNAAFTLWLLNGHISQKTSTEEESFALTGGK